MWIIEKNQPKAATFERWCKNLQRPLLRKTGESISWQNSVRGQNQIDNLEKTREKFEEEVQSAADQKTNLNVHLHSASSIEPNLPSINLNFSEKFKFSDFTTETEIQFDLFDTGNCKNVRIVRGIINKLTIHGSLSIVEIDECYISHLDIYGSKASINIKNCWIGAVVLTPDCVNVMSITGGSIRTIECPSPDQDNPFTGSISFKNVQFPTSSNQSILLTGPQAYRNLRAHLEKLENAPAANLMRSLELATERYYDDRLFTKAVSWVYGTFANYGASPGRPLAWAFVLYLLTVGFIYHFDGGVLTSSHDYFGWRSAVAEPGFWGQLKRSLILPLQSVTNPFGLFGVRKLVVAATGWGHIVLTTQGFITVVLIAMSLFGIRRRFKLN